jgi:hypothetical protein
MGAGQQIDRLLEVVEAAKKFMSEIGDHPTTGACSTDHWVGRKCDCGYEELKTALNNLENKTDG